MSLQYKERERTQEKVEVLKEMQYGKKKTL